MASGYDVGVSNSRGPETLSALVKELGPRARAGTAVEAAKAGEIVVVTVPLKAYCQVPVEPLAGKVVIDTNNYSPTATAHPRARRRVQPLPPRADRAAGGRRGGAMTTVARRAFLTTLGAGIAAPAILRRPDRSVTGLEFVARVLVQIPDPGPHLVRYYGAYSRRRPRQAQEERRPARALLCGRGTRG